MARECSNFPGVQCDRSCYLTRECQHAKTLQATAPQPDPVKDPTAPSAHDLVIRDMVARKKMGLDKYGTLLQPENGRDSLVDAYQEVLDLAAYLRNEIERRDRARLAAVASGVSIDDLHE